MQDYEAIFGDQFADFRQSMDHHFGDYPCLPAKLPENRERMETFARDGVVILPDHFSAEIIEAARQRVHLMALALQAGSDILNDIPDSCKDRDLPYGAFRIYEIDKFYGDVCAPIRDDAVIADLVQSYMSNQAGIQSMAVELRTQSEGLDGYMTANNPMPHADHMFRQVKVFTLLEDVNEDNGPMVYWTGTQKDEEWRWSNDYMRFVGLSPFNADRNFSEYMMNTMDDNNPEVRRITCTGTAGTVIIADVRGVHRASMVNSGHRLHVYTQHRMFAGADYSLGGKSPG